MHVYLIRHGESERDITKRFGGDYDDHLSKLADRNQTILGGESYPDFRGRVVTTMETVLGEQAVKSVAMVTHGGFIRVVFREMLRLGEISIDDCACAKLKVENKGIVVEKLRGIQVV